MRPPAKNGKGETRPMIDSNKKLMISSRIVRLSKTFRKGMILTGMKSDLEH